MSSAIQSKRGERAESAASPSKSGRRGEMGLARCRNFVQRAAHETAAKHRVDGGNAEGQGAGTVLDPGRSLQGLQALAQLRDHTSL